MFYLVPLVEQEASRDVHDLFYDEQLAGLLRTHILKVGELPIFPRYVVDHRGKTFQSSPVDDSLPFCLFIKSYGLSKTTI